MAIRPLVHMLEWVMKMSEESIFDKVEQRAHVSREDIMRLAKSVSGQDLSDEDNLRSLIQKVARMAGKEVTEEKTEKIISAVKKDKVPKSMDKLL